MTMLQSEPSQRRLDDPRWDEEQTALDDHGDSEDADGGEADD